MFINCNHVRLFSIVPCLLIFLIATIYVLLFVTRGDSRTGTTSPIHTTANVRSTDFDSWRLSVSIVMSALVIPTSLSCLFTMIDNVCTPRKSEHELMKTKDGMGVARA